ncbi:mitochondrial ribosomal protein subunit L20-domain-containing protein [Hypoxylon crocopeplum]|nr:mitochondrial ribosomal protein subunit L20-domain-containing protein [Hypoxylon crocopeplum]
MTTWISDRKSFRRKLQHLHPISPVRSCQSTTHSRASESRRERREQRRNPINQFQPLFPARCLRLHLHHPRNHYTIARMETRSLMQPLLRSIAKSSLSTSPRAAATTTSIPRRHQSTTARTKRALKIAPHPSFFPSSLSQSSQIIFNPPSSTASVYHTPFKFLPRSDPRRQANLTQLIRSSSSSSSGSNQLPPELKSPPQKYNVTREQVDEMRGLRAEDPQKWSVLRLAEKYGCAPIFVMACCRAPAEHRSRERARLDAVKARWGPIRTAAREDRRKRRDLLLKDAL